MNQLCFCRTVVLQPDHIRRLPGSRAVSIRTSIGLDEPKQILISYVRAEAAQYALRLKEFLTDDGFSVYLVSQFVRFRSCG